MPQSQASPAPWASFVASIRVLGLDLTAARPVRFIYLGKSGTSSITVKSLGGFAGTVNLAATVSASVSGTLPSLSPASLSLASGGTGTSILTLSTSAANEKLTYAVTVTATAQGGVPSRSATVSFFVTIRGDLSLDCIVNIIDLAMVGASFGGSTGGPTFNPAADVNNDGTINIIELATVGANFGRRC